MALLLNASDVADALAGEALLPALRAVIEEALRDMAGDRRPRAPVSTPVKGAGAQVVSVMGLLPGAAAAGGRLHLVGRPVRADGPRHAAYKVVFDLDTLNLVALLEDGPVHEHMLSARVAVATAWLAREDATTAAVLGSGRMARASLRGVCAAREVKAVAVYSPDAGRCTAFAEEAAEELGVEVRPVPSAQEAVADADLVTCATSNHFRGGPPVYEAEWLRPGAHVNSIARSETGAATYRAVQVFPPSWPELLAVHPEWDGLRALVDAGEVRADRDLAGVVAGTAPGRASDEDITLYVAPSTGPEHLAVGRWVCERARAKGIGLEWDQDHPTKEASR